MTDTIRTELLIAPNGDVYAQLRCNNRTIEEKLVRGRCRPRQEVVDEAWAVANAMFDAEMKRRQQLPLFSTSVITKNRKDAAKKDGP